MARNDDLLERMARSKSGWKFADLERLYDHYNFRFRDKGKHRVYSHRDYPDLRASVTRARSLPVGYIQEAVSLIRDLQARLATPPENP